MFALKFSFVLRYHRDVPRSILVPLEKLVGINLAGFDENVTDAVMAVIEKDDALLNELFGDYAPTYRETIEHRDIYWKDAQRYDEELVLVQVDA